MTRGFGRIGWRVAVLLAALVLALPAAADDFAQARPLKKVKIGVATGVVNISYPWLNMPLALGYWKDEGYDVEVLPMGASLASLQQMVGGNADFVQINSSIVIQANVVNDIPVRVVMTNGVIDWSISVLDDSPIKNVKDLKGKSVGVFSLATGGLAFMRQYLRASGMDPDRDVQVVAVGLGAPAVDALRTNKVDGLLYWAAAQATFENAGLKLRHIVSPDWRSYPDFSLTTLKKTIDADPAMVEAIGRGAAKATVFALANPDCVRRLQWANWPATKPSGAPDEATLVQWDLNNLRAQSTALQEAFDMNGGKLWGNTTAEAYGRIQKFMLDAKQIEKDLPPSTYLIGVPGFYEKINNFDVAAVRAQAAACPAK